jgi:hypothetical protein
MQDIDHTTFTRAGRDTANSLTNAMILHPVACGLAFIAFCVSIGASVIGSLLSFFIGAIAWVMTVVVMAIDFSLFGVRDPPPQHHHSNVAVDYQKPCQSRRLWISRLLLDRHVGSPCGHGPPLLRHVHRPLYLLQRKAQAEIGGGQDQWRNARL